MTSSLLLAADIVSTAAGGNWSAGATWVGGGVPGGNDNVGLVEGAVVTLDTDLSALTVVVAPGATLKLNSYTCSVLGDGILNAGTIDGSGTRLIHINPTPPPDIVVEVKSTLRFAGTAAQGFANYGTVVVPLWTLEVANPAGFAFVPNSNPTTVLNVYLTSGAITSAGRLTLGYGSLSSASPTVFVQVADGSFADPPTFDLGPKGQSVTYLTSSTNRVTGIEINPSRILSNLTINNANLLTHQVSIAGGNLTVHSLSLLDGRIVASEGNILVMAPDASVLRDPPAIGTTTVDGTMRKTVSAPGQVTFEVGTASGYSPVTVNVTGGTFPVDITVGAHRGRLPTYYESVNALKRYWTVSSSANVQAGLLFFYHSGDVFTRTESNFKLVSLSVIQGLPWLSLQNSTVDTGGKAVSVGNVNGINGSWFIIGEPDTDLDGVPDAYEIAHGFNPNTPVVGLPPTVYAPWDPRNPLGDAHTDIDGDGFSNLQEFNMGSDPKNPDDRWRIVSITKNDPAYAAPNYLVQCSASDFKSYRLDFKNALTDPNWTFLRFSNPHVGLPTAPIHDVTVGTAKQRFYRVTFDLADQL